MTPEILACSLGNCVHVAGPLAFLELARSVGYDTVFLGAATPVDKLLDAIEEHAPDLVAVSYRLTPEVSVKLFAQLREGLRARGLEGIRLALGGTPPVGRAGEESGLFEAIFTGGEGPDEVLDFLRGEATEHGPEDLEIGRAHV